MKSKIAPLSALAIVMAVSLGTVACEDRDYNDTEDAIEDTADEVEDAVD